MSGPENRRILLVDDTPSVHEDFRKALSPAVQAIDMEAEEEILFGKAATPTFVPFSVESAYQGAEALEKVRAALRSQLPYALAFVDMRMPPGWDGVETIERLWSEDPRIQIAICSAYSDHSWMEVLGRLDARDRLVILKKPFDRIEVYQLANALTVKWQMTEQAAFKMGSLERAVQERTQALEQSREMFKLVAESTRAIPFTLDLMRGCFSYIGEQAITDFNLPEAHWRAPGVLDRLIPRETNQELRQLIDRCKSGPFEFVAPLTQADGRRTEVRWTGTCEWAGDIKRLRGLMLDITEVRRLARERMAAQKLESVGRLAAGVAHEINTPVQFISDNVEFVRSSMRALGPVIQAYRELKAAVENSADARVAARAATAAEEAADLDYVLADVPTALDSALEGIARVATIVRSMKQFAHPDQAEKTYADLNQAIRSTLVIAHSEYKYVATLDADLGELPLVPCHLGDINQVILNLLVNAAHAVADVVKDSGNLGRISVRTRLDGDAVEIAIGDSGTGIPESVRDKIFDPFFTTKEVGRGTGQGLALAHSAIVKDHGGTLRFETECGRGTTFFVRLPVVACSAPTMSGAAAAA